MSDNFEQEKEMKIIKKQEEHKIIITPHDNSSGEGGNVPKGVSEQFNWGAFLFNWVWGIKYKKWALLIIPFLCTVPLGFILAIAAAVWAGKHGNSWAWQEVSYANEQDFHDAQKAWVKAWFVLAGAAAVIAGIVYVNILTNRKKEVKQEVVSAKLLPMSIPQNVYDSTVYEDIHSDFIGSDSNIIYWIEDETPESSKKLESFNALLNSDNNLSSKYIVKPDLIPVREEAINGTAEDENAEQSVCIEKDRMCIAKWLNKTCKSSYCILNMKYKQYYRVGKQEDVLPAVRKLQKQWN